MWDNASNFHSYSLSELQLLGFPTELQVTSNEDTSFPTLEDFDFDPQSIDVTSGPADVIVSLAYMDSPAGVSTVQCGFLNPSQTTIETGSASLSSGDIFNGTWTCTVTIPQYAEEGTWTPANIQVWDNASNFANWVSPPKLV